MPKVEKEIPWCTVILVMSTLTCHYLVLQGNLSTSAAMQNMGASTGGWSRVGLGLARSLRDELDILMTNVTAMLTDAINQTVGVQEYIDVVVSMIGNVTDGAADKAKKEAEAALLQISQDPSKPSDTMETAKKLGETITSGVNGVIGNLISMLTTKLGEFLEAIKPALYKCGEWLLKFGDQIQQVLESFSITLDKVQKIFDQIMSELNGGPPEEVVDKMLYDTFSLFDVSKSGAVTLQDLEDIGEMYSIESLGGGKAKDLLTKYDQNKDKKLDKKEYKLFVDDPDIPGSMAVVLRKYAKKMSNIAGVIAQARKRDEMSLAVVNFMQLVCSKNRTKMSWVAQMLTNATLPVEFTAAILSQLAIEKDNPDLLTKDDVGDLVISEMLMIDFNGTMQAYNRMMNISWWTEEGFDPLDFALMTQRVTDWIVNASITKNTLGDDIKVEKGKPDKIILSQTEIFQHFSTSAYALGKLHLDDHCRARQEKHLKRKNELFNSESQHYMLHHLLGGVMASERGGGGGSGSSAAEQAVNSGQPCKPVTLEFAKWLAWNCSDQVNVFIKQCFDYSSESSSALDSFATNIQALVKKIQSFLNMMEKYATPAGIDKLTEQIMNFTGKAADDIARLVNTKLSGIINDSLGPLNASLTKGLNNAARGLSEMISGAIMQPLGGAITTPLGNIIGKAVDNEDAGDKLGGMLGGALTTKLQNLTTDIITGQISGLLKQVLDKALLAAKDQVDQVSDKFGGSSLIETHAMVNSEHQLSAEALSQLHADIELQGQMSGVWDTIVTVLQALSNFLPQSTKILKFARKEVSEAAKGMDSVFKTFEVKGPQIFDMVAGMWSMVWVLYFFLVCPIGLGLLFYGFWASGYCGGPRAIRYEDEDIPAPTTFTERCYVCCNACSMCMKGYHDTALCFWSFIIFAQVVCLLLFVISLLICILAGVNAFLVAGCSQVYMLADPKVCGQTLGFLKAFLDTFHVNLPTEMLEGVCNDNQLLTCQLIEAKMKKAMVYTTVFSFLAALLSFQMLIESALLHERARWRRIIDGLDDKES